MLELSHISYAVKDLDQALVNLRSAIGGNSTEPKHFDMLMHMPLEGSEPRRIQGRSAWLVGEPTPIELWQGGEDTPWQLSEGEATLRVHHNCFWVDDLDAVASQFQSIDFNQEMTPVHDGPGLLGFCYLRNAEGTRIELQSSVDKDSVHKWITKGSPKHLSWLQYTR